MTMKILRLKEVIKVTGLARSTIYAKMSTQGFPHSISLGGSAIGWVEEEVLGWINERIEERDQLNEQKNKGES